MIRVLGRILTIVALCFAISLQWLALQSIGWATMLITYSKSSSFLQAVSQTFDGNHPCALCHAAQKGKASEDKSNFSSSTVKVDLISTTERDGFLPPSLPVGYSPFSADLIALGHAPPSPPPRLVS